MHVSQSTAFSAHTNSRILLFWLAMLGIGFDSLKNIGMAVARPAPLPTHTHTHTGKGVQTTREQHGQNY